VIGKYEEIVKEKLNRSLYYILRVTRIVISASPVYTLLIYTYVYAKTCLWTK